MKRVFLALLMGLTLATVGATASAQDMTFGEDGDVTAEPAADGAATPPADGAAAPADSGDVIGDLASQNTDTSAQTQDSAPRITEASEEIYAVQQIYALRNGRVELSPYWSTTVNDQYVSHPAVGLGLNYWWTNVLAVGLNFNWYGGLENESDLNFHVRRSTRLAVPITEYQLGANLNFTYVPLYGKFSMFNDYIFQWDAYIVGGVGLMRTRPVAVVDPEIRTHERPEFNYQFRVAFNVDIGIRVFLTRWLAFFGELRDYAYLERLESTDVALGEARQDPSTWLASSPSLTNNVTAQLGLTVFFPFTFEYRLPR